MEETEVSQCMGCGYCCKKSLCVLAVTLLPDSVPEGECPFLYQEDDRYKCILAIHERWAKELYIGEGCCSGMNSVRLQIIHAQSDVFIQVDPASRLHTSMAQIAKRKHGPPVGK